MVSYLIQVIRSVYIYTGVCRSRDRYIGGCAVTAGRWILAAIRFPSSDPFCKNRVGPMPRGSVMQIVLCLRTFTCVLTVVSRAWDSAKTAVRAAARWSTNEDLTPSQGECSQGVGGLQNMKRLRHWESDRKLRRHYEVTL